jgi:hypothetical protein
MFSPARPLSIILRRRELSEMIRTIATKEKKITGTIMMGTIFPSIA